MAGPSGCLHPQKIFLRQMGGRLRVRAGAGKPAYAKIAAAVVLSFNETCTRHFAWRADPLVWGHGPHVFEVYLKPTCPFSVRAFGKLEDLLDKAGEDRITVKVRLQSQPWHMYSG